MPNVFSFKIVIVVIGMLKTDMYHYIRFWFFIELQNAVATNSMYFINYIFIYLIGKLWMAISYYFIADRHTFFRISSVAVWILYNSCVTTTTHHCEIFLLHIWQLSLVL